jgi:hypothetical protein
MRASVAEKRKEKSEKPALLKIKGCGTPEESGSFDGVATGFVHQAHGLHE